MKYLLIYIGLLCTSLQLWGQETVATRIAPPTGYVRELVPIIRLQVTYVICL